MKTNTKTKAPDMGTVAKPWPTKDIKAKRGGGATTTKGGTRAKPINSREKGAAAEREFSRLVFDHLGVSLRRNLEQSRNGGHDLTAHGTDPVSIALDAYAIEVKRWRAITPAMLAGFWRQAEQQAERAGKVPVLAFRQDRQEWRVLLPLVALNAEAFGTWPGIEWTAAVSVEAFYCLIREKAHIANRGDAVPARGGNGHGA